MNKRQEILSKLGITQLNEMQVAVDNAITTSNDDIVVLSPTGSGKTLAYLLPLVEQVNTLSDDLQMVVVVPGRELALQSADVLRYMSCGVRAMAIYGGRPAMDEHRAMVKTKPHVVFATPGRLNDHIDKGNIIPTTVRTLVIDEFDKCLAMGFHQEMEAAVDRLTHLRRRVLLSATDADSIPHFVNMHHARRLVFLDEEKQVPERVEVFTVFSPVKDKLETLSRLLREQEDKSSIVFLNYRDSVERTAEYLLNMGFVATAFHGGLDQKSREEAIYKFSNGSANILVATDLASRGHDIPNVDNNIHYHLPLGEEEYVHRVGRTARWNSSGTTWFVLGPEEHLPEYVVAGTQPHVIPDDLPAPKPPRMATLYVGKGKKDKISKGDIVGFLCKKGQLEKSDIGRIDVMERYAYVAVNARKVKQVLALTRNEKIKGVRTIVEPVR